MPLTKDVIKFGTFAVTSQVRLVAALADINKSPLPMT
jgi:hypothetical protein